MSRLARGLPTRAAERDRPQPHRGEQEAPCALGVALGAVFGEEAQMTAQLLAVHRAPVLRGRRAADVDELRAGVEQHLPARLPKAVEPVGLLAEHEEILVEEANRVGGPAPDEEAGAHQELGLAYLVVVEARPVERVQRA